MHPKFLFIYLPPADFDSLHHFAGWNLVCSGLTFRSKPSRGDKNVCLLQSQLTQVYIQSLHPPTEHTKAWSSQV